MMGRKPNTRAKVRRVLDVLEERYGKARFVSRFDPMDELVSCILSQHTADANSFPAFTRLRAAYPDWQQVVDAGPAKIADVVRKAGLANQKAKSIINALKEVRRRVGDYSLEQLRGMEMREARDWLMSLPGVGPKTASIVLCFSLGMPAIPVDTHVFRVSKRLGLIPESADEKKAHDLLLEVVAPQDAFRYHTSLIQHGRKTCKAQRPLCDQCPLTRMCVWFKEQRSANA